MGMGQNHFNGMVDLACSTLKILKINYDDWYSWPSLLLLLYGVVNIKTWICVTMCCYYQKLELTWICLCVIKQAYHGHWSCGKLNDTTPPEGICALPSNSGKVQDGLWHWAYHINSMNMISILLLQRSKQQKTERLFLGICGPIKLWTPEVIFAE